jgi:drug/metabolite transporter (DMT)-like permease|tara:strand:+ start:95 stop:994 length:900 start_codon:yes stop_codon:yes gene_type:complete
MNSSTNTWQAYLMLTITALCWGLNALFGQLAVGEVSPMALVFLRWVCVVILVTLFMRKPLLQDWPVLRTRKLYLFLMGSAGFAAFNGLFYVAAHYTTALNIGILQGSIPVFVLLGALVAYRTSITQLQILGVTITLVGVVLVATGGDWTRLVEQAINRGDFFMLMACLLYAGYAVALRNRPAVSPLSVFAVLACVALISSFPLLAFEIITGEVQWPTAQGWVVVALVALLPSFIAQIFFIQGVGLIGPGRAGLFINLVPVFSAVLAVLILNENFQWFHGMALVLVLGGIAVAELGKGKG